MKRPLTLVISFLALAATAVAGKSHPSNRRVRVFFYNATWAVFNPHYPLTLDGQTIARLGAHEFTWFSVTPGRHEIALHDPLFKGFKIGLRTRNFGDESPVYLEYVGPGFVPEYESDRDSFKYLTSGEQDLYLALRSIIDVPEFSVSKLLKTGHFVPPKAAPSAQ